MKNTTGDAMNAVKINEDIANAMNARKEDDDATILPIDKATKACKSMLPWMQGRADSFKTYKLGTGNRIVDFKMLFGALCT